MLSYLFLIQLHLSYFDPTTIGVSWVTLNVTNSVVQWDIAGIFYLKLFYRSHLGSGGFSFSSAGNILTCTAFIYVIMLYWTPLYLYFSLKRPTFYVVFFLDNNGGWIGQIHRATMSNLALGTQYKYRVGDGFVFVFDF